MSDNLFYTWEVHNLEGITQLTAEVTGIDSVSQQPLNTIIGAAPVVVAEIPNIYC